MQPEHAERCYEEAPLPQFSARAPTDNSARWTRVTGFFSILTRVGQYEPDDLGTFLRWLRSVPSREPTGGPPHW
jgi:hypothetical protein